MILSYLDMKLREIEKNPAVPILSDRAISLLTELCFRKDDELTTADVLLVFGSQHGINELVDEMYRILTKHLVPVVIVTGGIPTFKDSLRLKESESHTILHKINRSLFPDVVFHTESVSENTLENVQKALIFPEFRNAKKVMFIFKSQACGRGYLTLRHFFPDTQLIQRSFSVTYKDELPIITRENWWQSDFSKSRVWGEFLRIERCGSRGDIAYPQEVANLVKEIRKEVSFA